MAPLEMNEGTPSGVGYNKLNSFSVEDPAKRPLTFKAYGSEQVCVFASAV
jgi:hypothetical protein